MMVVSARSFAAIAIAASLSFGGCSGRPPAILPHAPEIDPYVGFLTGGHLQAPVDYVMGLFADADLVVLSERHHAELTQYDLIMEVVSDPRFIDGVGHIFTEIGSISTADEIAAFLSAEGLSDAERDAWRLRIYRDFSDEPHWARYNYYDLLGRLYELNQGLAPDRKVQLHPVGLPFTWKGMTPEAYRAYADAKGDRDERMAAQIQENLGAIIGGGDVRGKALVIMNYRHAFPHLDFPGGGRLHNTTGFLMERFSGRVRSVMLNSLAPTGGPSEADMTLVLIADGKWDAAFEATGNTAVGFDLAGTPFGQDPFDYFPFGIEPMTYADAFSGFILYNPLAEHMLVNGIPGILDEDFEKELRRRLEIVGGYETDEARDAFIDARRTQQIESYECTTEGIPLKAPIVEQWKRWLQPAVPGEDGSASDGTVSLVRSERQSSGR